MSRDFVFRDDRRQGRRVQIYNLKNLWYRVCYIVKFFSPIYFLRSAKKHFLGSRECPFYNRAPVHNS